jgi:hypothetical protein
MKFLKALFAKKQTTEEIGEDEAFETPEEIIARTNKLEMQMYHEFEEANKTGIGEELA